MRSKNKLSFLALLLLSCNAPETPKEVAGHFINASLKMNFIEAKKYATPETAKMLDFVQNITARAHADTIPFKNMKIEIGKETIDGDDATVTYKKEGSNENYIINLKRTDEKWLVTPGIGDINTESDLQSAETDAPSDSSNADHKGGN